LKNPQLIYEQHPSSKEENITIIVILPLQAADLEKLSGRSCVRVITQDMNKSFHASHSEEDFATIVPVFSTIQHRWSRSTFYSTQQFYSEDWIIIREKVIIIQHEYCSDKA